MADSFPARNCRVFGACDRWQMLRDAGLDSLEALTSRSLGDIVTDHRSSWVRRITLGARSCYVKTYDYPGMRDRLRGALRNTFLAPSRARREFEALTWLRAHELAAPVPWVVCERRRFGFLQRACLVTERWPGDRVDRLLPALEPSDRDALLRAVERHIERVHRAGFRHRNLDLRNVLARQTDHGWEIALLDAPRFKLVAPGAAFDELAKRDWDRLARSLGA